MNCYNNTIFIIIINSVRKPNVIGKVPFGHYYKLFMGNKPVE